MTDLILDEYEGVSREELGQRLKEEAGKMFGPESPPLLHHQKQKRLALALRYFAKLTASISFLAHISQKESRI